MEYLLSILYTTIDSVCLFLFLGIFSVRRLPHRPFFEGCLFYIIGFSSGLYFNKIVFQNNQISKIAIILCISFIVSKFLYSKISSFHLLFLITIEYLLTYLLSFSLGIFAAFICNTNGNNFRSMKLPLIVYSILYYSSELSIVLILRKILSVRSSYRTFSKSTISQIALYFLFPCTSFVVLVILLYVTSEKHISEAIISGCCLLIFFSNIVILILLEQSERAAQNREHIIALNQQLQLQEKSIESICGLYNSQRKNVHDFRAHIGTLTALLKSHDYSSAEDYLSSLSSQQTERLFLVNTHNTILDALFNTKAAEAIHLGIDVDFDVNDLSTLPLDSTDMIVLLSNLIDNAIEACESYPGHKSIQISAILNCTFLFSIRNTTTPVKIVNDNIKTTKSNPQIHGFGLANVKAILEKYHGDYVMLYENEWFQFTGEIPF